MGRHRRVLGQVGSIAVSLVLVSCYGVLPLSHGSLAECLAFKVGVGVLGYLFTGRIPVFLFHYGWSLRFFSALVVYVAGELLL